jgi:hypothetical protein
MRSLFLLLSALGAALAIACEPILIEEETAGTHAKKQACATCHMNDYRAARDPVHVGFRPSTCEICHAQTAWHPQELDHPWPLTGKHAKASCYDCHTGDPPKFKGTKKDCIRCHEKDFARQNEREPWHAKMGETCGDCHTTDAFDPVKPDAREHEPPEDEDDARDAGPPADAAPPAASATPKKTTPTPTARPKPKPTPTPTQLPTVAPPRPDTTTGASRRRPRVAPKSDPE